jgi:hypothetical protein
VIIERRGKPTAVIVSIAAYDELQTFREDKQKRADALERLRRLDERLAAHNRVHNSDLSEEEAIELSVRIERERIDRMAERGEITFERDLRRGPS